MKNRIINLTIEGEKLISSAAMAGFEGEHLATRLDFTLPEDWSDPELEYIVIFKNENKTYCRSMPLTDTLSVLLPQAIMKSGWLKIQLIAQKKANIQPEGAMKTACCQLQIRQSLEPFEPVNNRYAGLIDESIETLKSAARLAENVAAEVASRLNKGEFIGEKGDQGQLGERGPQGLQGPKGEQGEKGNPGDRGQTGPQGDAGISGKDGKSPRIGILGNWEQYDVTAGQWFDSGVSATHASFPFYRTGSADGKLPGAIAGKMTITAQDDTLVWIYGKNLFDGEWTYGQVKNTTTGQDSISARGAYSSVIPCMAEDELIISGMVSGGTMYVSYYDENGNYLDRSAGGTVNATKRFTPVDETRFVVISCTNETAEGMPYSRIQVERFPEGFNKLGASAYEPYKINSIIKAVAGSLLSVSCLEGIEVQSSKPGVIAAYPYNPVFSNSPLFGKKIVLLGDDISELRSENGYMAYIRMITEKYGAKCTSYAYAGSRISLLSTGTTSFIERYADMTDDADLVLVLGGTNDFNAQVSIGEAGSTSQNTFCGALNRLIEGLLAKYPNKEIVFVTPPPRIEEGKSVSLAQYALAIKAACEKYSVPCFNLYNASGMKSGIGSVNPSLYAAGSIHPNQNGQAVMARHIEEFLNQC